METKTMEPPTMMDTKTIITKYYEFANANDWDSWCNLFAENMKMDEQLAGHIEGRTALRNLMKGMPETYAKFHNAPEKIIVSGEEAAVVSHISAVAKSNGASIQAEVMNYFRTNDSKIQYMSNYHDSRPFAPVLHKNGSATPKIYPVIHSFLGKFMELPKDHVNAYIVELENSVVVIDTTLAYSSATGLRKEAESFGKPIRAVLLTHGHPDHYTGLVAFKDIPSYASQGCLDFAREEDMVKSPTAESLLDKDYPDVRDFPNKIIQDGFKLTFDGVTFTFHDLGPAESPSDGMWVIDQGTVKHVFVGDVVALNCHCFFRDGYAREWNKVLERLDAEFDSSALFYIGHGEVPVSKEAIYWQLGYNKAFLKAVDSLPDKTVPVSQANQDKVMAAMRKYLPADVTLFLLQYELGEAISLHFPHKGFGMGQGRQFYIEHMNLLNSGKIDELISLHYAKDATIVTFDGIHHGHAAIREYILDTFQKHKVIQEVTMNYFAESEDVIIFRATVKSEGRGTINAQDAFCIEDGKIKKHIALTLVPDADYDALGTRWVS